MNDIEKAISDSKRRTFLEFTTYGYIEQREYNIEKGKTLPTVSDKKWYRAPQFNSYNERFGMSSSFPPTKMRVNNIYHKNDVVFISFEQIPNIRPVYFDNFGIATSRVTLINIKDGESRILKVFESPDDFDRVPKALPLEASFHVPSSNKDLTLLVSRPDSEGIMKDTKGHEVLEALLVLHVESFLRLFNHGPVKPIVEDFKINYITRCRNNNIDASEPVIPKGRYYLKITINKSPYSNRKNTYNDYLSDLISEWAVSSTIIDFPNGYNSMNLFGNEKDSFTFLSSNIGTTCGKNPDELEDRSVLPEEDGSIYMIFIKVDTSTQKGSSHENVIFSAVSGYKKTRNPSENKQIVEHLLQVSVPVESLIILQDEKDFGVRKRSFIELFLFLNSKSDTGRAFIERIELTVPKSLL